MTATPAPQPPTFELNDTTAPLLIQRMKAEAADRSESAGLSGAMHDGGAGLIHAEIAAFEAGRAGTIPASWQKVADKWAAEMDPEYAEFLRLHARFGQTLKP